VEPEYLGDVVPETALLLGAAGLAPPPDAGGAPVTLLAPPWPLQHLRQQDHVRLLHAGVEIAQDGAQTGQQCLIESAHPCWSNVVACIRNHPLVWGVELAHQISEERCGRYQPHTVSGPLASTQRGHHARRERESIIFDRCPPSELPVGRDLRCAGRVPAGALSAQRNGLSVRPSAK
jgi:hypothetical protein